MKPVIQEDVTGCGIACVAMLTGQPYQRTKRIAERLGISVADPSLWSETYSVRKLLKHFSVPTSQKERPFHSWHTLPTVALLATKWHVDGERVFWHWVVFWRSPRGPVALDSKRALRHHVRKDFGRIKPKWFIEVSPRKSTLQYK